MISLRARSASLHSAVTSTVNAVKRSGVPSSVPVTATLTFGHRRFARANRAKQVTGEAAAERYELIFAARRAEIEAALGDTSVDEDRMRANDGPRRGVGDVLDRGLERGAHAESLA